MLFYLHERRPTNRRLPNRKMGRRPTRRLARKGGVQAPSTIVRSIVFEIQRFRFADTFAKHVKLFSVESVRSRKQDVVVRFIFALQAEDRVSQPGSSKGNEERLTPGFGPMSLARNPTKKVVKTEGGTGTNRFSHDGHWRKYKRNGPPSLRPRSRCQLAPKTQTSMVSPRPGMKSFFSLIHFLPGRVSLYFESKCFNMSPSAKGKKVELWIKLSAMRRAYLHAEQ